MKFKKYVKESNESASKMNTLNENFLDNDWNPDKPSLVQDQLERFYGPVKKLIDEGKFEEAQSELADLERDLNELEAENSKKKFFKFPQFMIDAERNRIEALRAKLPKNESIDDMDKRCEKCNTPLNDSGTCPKCDDGEEDYGDDIKESCSDYHVKKYGAYWFGIIGPDGLMLRNENNKLRLFKNKADAQKFIDETCNQLNENMSVREKLKAAYPELNFDNPVTEECVKEELSNKEKLKRAFPELNFDTTEIKESKEENITESAIKTEGLSNKEKLKRAYPELNFDSSISENIDPEDNFDYDPEDNFDYDDDYDIDDDVEMDRRHAALYGGDRMYCDCGTKLSHDEYGVAYCPKCEPHDSEDAYTESCDYDDTI